VAALALGASACVTSSDIEKLQSQISDLQVQLAQIKRTAAGKEDVQNVNTKIAEQTATLVKSNAQVVAKVDQMDDRVANVTGSLEQTNYRVDKLAQQMTQAQHDIDELRAAVQRAATPPPGTTAAPGAAPVPGAPMAEVNVTPPVGSSESPLSTYQAAYRDYQRGNYDLAIQGFRDFAEHNPNSDLAPNAAYWIGESLFSQKKYAEAIQQFDSVVTKYPQSEKVPGALLKKGYAYQALGEKAQAIVQLQYVVHEHPNSPEAALAKQKLKQLGVTK
jgi:tol-pal system protein YbgF